MAVAYHYYSWVGYRMGLKYNVNSMVSTDCQSHSVSVTNSSIIKWLSRVIGTNSAERGNRLNDRPVVLHVHARVNGSMLVKVVESLLFTDFCLSSHCMYP